MPNVARADRAAGQYPAGLVLEKAGKHAEAALYYHRALRGFQEVWIQYWHYGDQNKAHPMTQQLVAELTARMNACLQKAGMSQAQRAHMEAMNELWMEELVDQEQGCYKLAFAWRAEEAERHGDFLFAEKLRLAAADYCRLVGVTYHQRAAAKLAGLGRNEEATLHRQAAADYGQEAAEHEAMARGDRALAAIPGLQGPNSQPDPKGLSGHYFKSYVLYHERVLSTDGGKWLTGRSPQEVAAILKQTGLKHADESARLASVAVLANLGAQDGLLVALADQSAHVRLAAAKSLAAAQWADGWAACHGHADGQVREAVKPLLEPAGKEVLARTAVIAELLRGPGDSAAAGPRTFCQDALQRITGEQKIGAEAWGAWWKQLGNAQPGLVRNGPDGKPVVDHTVDAGAWWQSGVRCLRGAPNPLSQYSLPAKITWRGDLVVTRPGTYRFYLRTQGEKQQGINWQGPGDRGIVHFTAPCAKLAVNGKAVLPTPDFIEDDKMHMRVDCGEPIRLEPGLHAIQLELDVKAGGTPGAMWDNPCARLYWSSEHFLREIVPADHLLHREEGKG